MTDVKDIDLLRRYAEQNSEPAFATLVERHINLVYCVALRFTRNEPDAQDVAQAVFIILAQKAAKLRPPTILAGWLYETTRFAAMNLLRSRARQQAREQEAYMESTLNESPSDAVWQHLEPLLEEGMSRLNGKDRTLLALRFFENKSGGETAAALGIAEWAARKRTDRAVEKLRKFFARRGVTLSGGALAETLSAYSVQPAPPALAGYVAAIAVGKGATAGASTLTLIKGALKLMAWTKMKTAAIVGGVVLVAGGGMVLTVLSKGGGGNLTAAEIIRKSQEAYAALSSYSDQGQTISSIGATAVAPHKFSIKLARPNLYRIEWEQNMGFFDQKGAAWSTGNGDFFKMGDGPAQTLTDKEQALGSATGVSGGAASSIPGTFFKMNWGNQLGPSFNSARRLKNQTIGGADCYVLTTESGGRARTLWIGRRDFLIHQVEDDTSAQLMKELMSAQIKEHPELGARLSAVAGDNKAIQTHTHIVVNKTFAAADFDYQASAPPGR